MSEKIKPVRLIIFGIMAVMAAGALYPLFLTAMVSLKLIQDFKINPAGWPSSFNFRNYIMVFQRASIPQAYRNSILITGFSMVIQVIFGTLAAYALTKMQFKRTRFFSTVFLAPMIFPITTIILPLYMFFRQIGLLNNFLGLIIIYGATGMPLAIFIFTSFMNTIPSQISEAAIIDGAGHFTIYSRLIIPLIRPAIATTIVVSSLGIWNDFFLPLLFITNRNLQTLPLKVFVFQTEYSNNWPSMCSLMIFMILPLIIAYIFLQKYIISGVVAGSVKG
ncbi:MAG: carbohydrate ABC transporter permease [Treponema sp.]|jgi:raffinose/stachyose/melibiose transport system permease protein|nr:carbohydrate ABC transporter permease [Treponema sp.]